MVDHAITIEGVDLQGHTYRPPALLQMNMEDFPKRFLEDLAKMRIPATQLSATSVVAGNISSPAQLYQPVQRVFHLAMAQLSCDSLMSPRLDPLRVASSGIVVRRLRRIKGKDQQDPPYESWIKCPDGKFRWQTLPDENADPTPALRPALKSGQPWLDSQLAAPVLAQAMTEVFTPAFLAPPATNTALNRTIAYAVLPTASSDVSDVKPGKLVYDPTIFAGSLPTLLKYNSSASAAPTPGAMVDYRWLSDDYAAAQTGGTSFPIFSAALLMLFRQFNAFASLPKSNAILDILNRRNVFFISQINVGGLIFEEIVIPRPKGQFFAEAYAALIEAAPGGSANLLMPDIWEPVTNDDQTDLIAAMQTVLQSLASSVQPPEGRYQDASRLYVARLFFRIKPDSQSCPCPPTIHWSEYNDIFNIAAWYASAQRSTAPIPLPDPTKAGFLQAAKPNVSFAVPDGLMAAMQGSTLKGLSSGSASGGVKLGLNWICGFNIPLITICAFFVLNIFLIVLNLVFFWVPFIKICIPIPVVEGDE